MNAPRSELALRKHLLADFRAGTVVFLIALPLCLGIALASGAPLFAGLLTGIIGGLLVPKLSGSHLTISGPAAGLVLIVSQGIADSGSWTNFTAAVVICGLAQVAFGLLKLGRVGEFFPSSVIKGMLFAIGIVIILKQIPHALGNDLDPLGDLSFQGFVGANSLSAILTASSNFQPAALILSSLALLILLIWEPCLCKRFTCLRIIPGPLVAVLIALIINSCLIEIFLPSIALNRAAGNFVNLPIANSLADLLNFFSLPSGESFLSREIWYLGILLACVASIETLLAVEAVDKLDPLRRLSDNNKELYAQGLGNMVTGFLGGLPMTAVIVRSSTNIYSGGITQLASFTQGALLLVAVIFLPIAINQIPLAALAAILLHVGFKLAHPKVFQQMYQRGTSQFAPFVTTIIAIVVTELLTGVLIGFGVGLYFVIKANRHASITMVQDGRDFLIRFNKDMSFIDRAELKEYLLALPNDTNVIVDGIKAQYIDQDIIDILHDFEISAKLRNIKVTFAHIYSKNDL